MEKQEKQGNGGGNGDNTHVFLASLFFSAPFVHPFRCFSCSPAGNRTDHTPTSLKLRVYTVPTIVFKGVYTLCRQELFSNKECALFISAKKKRVYML